MWLNWEYNIDGANELNLQHKREKSISVAFIKRWNWYFCESNARKVQDFPSNKTWREEQRKSNF